MRRRRITTTYLCLLAVLMLGSPSATAATTADHGMSPTPSAATVTVEEPAGMDSVVVWVGTAGPQVGDAVGTPRACVSARSSAIHEQVRDGRSVEVRTVLREAGCSERVHYRFDHAAWRATAAATVTTELETSVYERGPAGWELVDRHRGPGGTSTVDLTWNGTGDERVEPWMWGPGICYTWPPSPCVDAGLAVSRDAIVDGTVSFGALSTDIALTSTATGTLQWWAQVYV